MLAHTCVTVSTGIAWVLESDAQEAGIMASIDFSFSIPPSPGEDVGTVLADLAERFAGFGVATDRLAGFAVRGPLDDALADQLIARLADFARGAVRYICQNGPTVEVSRVIEHTGVKDGFTLGGYMSSLGFALKKVGVSNPLPLVDDHYEVDMDAARVLLAALDRYDEKHG
jgi:hypothetical protein